MNCTPKVSYLTFGMQFILRQSFLCMTRISKHLSHNDFKRRLFCTNHIDARIGQPYNPITPRINDLPYKIIHPINIFSILHMQSMTNNIDAMFFINNRFNGTFISRLYNIFKVLPILGNPISITAVNWHIQCFIIVAKCLSINYRGYTSLNMYFLQFITK